MTSQAASHSNTMNGAKPLADAQLDEAACERLAVEHRTPLFAYRAAVARTQVHRLRRALGSRVRLAYAVKANPFHPLLALFASEGLSFDVASLGELDRLTALGIPGQRLFFAGPGKRDEEIATAIDRGVRLQAEGFEDLQRVDRAAADRGLDRVAVNLRVQPLGVEESGRILGGSGPSAFGVDEEDLGALLAQLPNAPRAVIHGLHGFAASNTLCSRTLLANHARMFEIGRRLVQDHGLDLEQIDLGGGLGIPYEPGESELDVDDLGRGLDELLRQHSWFQGEVVLEPGRYLAAPCGTYLARVLRTKDSRGEHFAVLEGGINHLLRPLLTGQNFPIRRIGEPQDPKAQTREITLAGPLCTSLDRLGTVRLPPLRPGDLLAFDLAGAYGATEAMVDFLGHPHAAEIWLD